MIKMTIENPNESWANLTKKIYYFFVFNLNNRVRAAGKDSTLETSTGTSLPLPTMLTTELMWLWSCTPCASHIADMAETQLQVLRERLATMGLTLAVSGRRSTAAAPESHS